METKHTPGPWFFDLARHTGAMIVDAKGDHIVDLVVTSNTTAQSALPANARLIAAAPDLLEALQTAHMAVCNWIPTNAGSRLAKDKALSEIDAAIARATGNQ